MSAADKLTAKFYIPIVTWSIVLILSLICLTIQLLVIKQRFATNNSSITSIKKTFIFSSIVHLSGAITCIGSILQHTISGSFKICIAKGLVTFSSSWYLVHKWSMYSFFAYRAKLAQGIMPVLPQIVFNKIIPLNLISSFICTWILLFLFMKVKCPESGYIDTYFIWYSFPGWGVAVWICQEMINTIAYTALFILPLWKVSKKQIKFDEKSHNMTQLAFKKEMIWNITFTLIANLATLAYAISALPEMNALSYWWIFEGIDVFMNCLCCFMMMKQNYRYIADVCGCYKAVDIAMMMSTNRIKSTSSVTNVVDKSKEIEPQTEMSSISTVNSTTKTDLV